MPEDEKPTSKTGQSDQAILDTSKERFKLCEDAERELRKVALDDLKFRAGEQWDLNVKNKRAAENRPCMTVNVLAARERQILNNQRENRPAIKVNPTDDAGTVETGEILQGIIRHIEYDSDADTAYDTASASQCRNGFGYIRLLTEYESPTSMQQVIKIQREPNPFQIYMDPSSKKADRSDACFAFSFTTLTKAEYKEDYPGTELASLDDWNSVGDKDPGWLSEDGVRIVEYFYIEKEKDILLQLSNGKTILNSKLTKLPRKVTIVDKRDTEVCTVKYCKHNAVEILEKNDWPGQWIPIIPVLGDEVNVDGKVTYEGMVRWSKDPMRMKNVMASAEVEAIMLAPKAPWLAAAGQTEDFPEWKTANTQNHAVLRYKPIDINGKDVGPPQRIVQEPAIQAIAEAGAAFDEALRDVQGIYEAQYGARSQEKSGIAIARKTQQGEVANFHYSDNLTRAIKFLGRQILDLIPKIYSAPTVMRIIGEDGTQKVVKVNQMFTVGEGQNATQKKYDLTAGTYDVTVSSGPSWQTKRQEAVASMLELAKSFPKLPEVAGDLMVQSMDWPNHEKVAERLKKAMPPGLADDDPQDPKAQVQQLQGQLKQAGQQIAVLSKVNEEALDMIKTKQVEQQGKFAIEKMKEEMQTTRVVTVAEINTKAQDSTQRGQWEHEAYMESMRLAHEVGTQAVDNAAAMRKQASEQAHAGATQVMDQAHESGMADKQAEIASQQADQGHQQALEQQQQAAELQPEPATQ